MKKTTLLLVLTTLVRNLNAALGILAALAFGPPIAQAAVTEAWVQRYRNVVSNANDRASTVVSDAAGDIIVTGVTDDRIHGQDMLTIKYSGADGTPLWQQRYNGSANRDDYATAVAVDGNGNVVVTGYSNNGTNNDYYSARYAATDGALLWEKRYNGPANGRDEAHQLAVDGDDNVVVTGSSASVGSGGWWDYYTAKYAAASGALLWEQRYNGPANKSDYSLAVAADGSGNVVVTGYSEDGNGSTDNYTAKYAAANGALVWEKRSKNQIDRVNSYDRLNAVAVDDSGNVIVTGDSYSGVSGYSYYTAKYAATDGALLWERRSDCGGQAVEVVAVDVTGDVVVTGSSLGVNGYYNYYTAKYAAADGALLWEQRFNSPANDDDPARAVDVAVDARGNVVVIGASNHGLPNYDADYYTAKYMAADGALLWEKHYNSPANGPNHSEPRAAGVDGSGNVVVTGSAWNSDGSIDYYTAKYASLDGALLWEQRHNGPTHLIPFAVPNALAVDSSGNVVVMGASRNSNFTENIFTAKYAAADGALLWENRYTGVGRGVAVDGSGNVVVTGSAGNSDGSIGYYTAKYASLDGALLWEQRYANGFSTAVAVDASGNVVVTGWTYDTNSWKSDYYTAKYAAADGALLWERRYNGPANNDDEGQAVAVDASGNVVVMGNSGTIKYLADGTGAWTNNTRATALAVDGNGNVVVTGYSGVYPYYDYYMAKHAAADGALLWEKRDGPANGYDRAIAVAADENGNVVVTGSKRPLYNGTNADYNTAKYAAADGALLWEQRYNGPANGDDRVAGLALGPNGLVAITGTSSGDYATVVCRENLPPVSIELVPTGSRLRFNGVPGHSYNVERASAVTGPWSTLANPMAPPGGLIEYTDTSAPAGTAFYRTSTP